MQQAFSAATKIGGLTALFFVIGAVTGPGGMAAASTYTGTVGTGIANTAHGGVEAVKWGYEAAAPLFAGP